MTFLFLDIVDTLSKHPTKTYKQRDVEDVDTLVIHHTVSPGQGLVERIADYHINTKDWPGIAYHYVVAAEGQIYFTNYHTTISYHAYGMNERSIGVALQGDFTTDHPPEAQLRSARNLVIHLKKQFPRAVLLPHRKAGKSKTACPGDSWKGWFDRLKTLDDQFSIVWSPSREGLIDTVNQYERAGWVPDGQVFLADGTWNLQMQKWPEPRDHD